MAKIIAAEDFVAKMIVAKDNLAKIIVAKDFSAKFNAGNASASAKSA